jgi:hypothetical protein
VEIVTCPKCRAQLFVSNARALKCGSCGRPLRYKTEKSPGFFSRLKSRLFRKGRAAASPEIYPNLQSKVELLARKTWGSREDIERSRLELAPKAIQGQTDHGQLVTSLLKHVRAVAPGISVPMMTPRVVIEPTSEAAGLFVEQDGWVKIAVSPAFYDDLPAARSILCHELCHYVLNANGIRQSPTIENERLTDTAIFAFGLGEIFLAGYRKSATNYRAGHQLGYLSDAEYQFIRGYVPQLRRSQAFLKTAKRNDDWRWDRSLR